MTRPIRGVALAVAGIVALAAAMRVAVASLSPVLAEISADIAVPSAVVGLIGAAPPVSFAVFGILTPMFARRARVELLAVLAAAISAVGIVARAFSTDALTLVLTTLLAFAGIGVGNVLLPALVKKYFPDAVGRMTTVYVVSMSAATLVPPALAVPIADSVGWRWSLGVWAVTGAVACVPWLLLLRRARSGSDGALEEADPRVLARLMRTPLTWALLGIFVVNAATVYGLFAWMPTLMQEQAGVDPVTAGLMLAVFGGSGLPFGLIIPPLAARFGAIRSITIGAIVPGVVGVAGLLWAPTAAPWLWVVLLALPTAFFPLSVVLFGLRTRSHVTTVALSGAVQSAGYGMAALFPLGFGVLHSVTGGWDAVLWVLAGLFLLGIPAGFLAARPGSVEEHWERRGL